MAAITRDEEVALARRVGAEDRDAEAELVSRHMNFVRFIARKFRGLGVPTADLVQVGCIALLGAIRRFDPENGTRLTSYAHDHIYGRMADAVAKEARSRMEQAPDGDLDLLPDRAEPCDAPIEVDVESACERHLDYTERMVLTLRHGDLRRRSYRQVGELLGRTKPDVGRIHRRAIAKLRLALVKNPSAA